MQSIYDFVYLVLADPACLSGMAKQLLDRSLQVAEARLQLQQIEETLVGHDDPSIVSQHRQSMGHVVQSRVQSIRQHFHVSRLEQGVEINPAQSKRDLPHRDE